VARVIIFAMFVMAANGATSHECRTITVLETMVQDGKLVIVKVIKKCKKDENGTE